MTGSGVIRVTPGAVAGTVAAPSSKSVTHRAFLLGALSANPAIVSLPLVSHDTRATLSCLVQLGAHAETGPGGVRFEPAPLRLPHGVLDCANSGTTLRLLCATAARLPGPVALTGDASLRARPNGPLLDALHSVGARVRSAGGHAPVTVQGPIHPGTVRIPAASSSQFASALLLSLPLLPGDSAIHLQAPIASRPYLDVTVDVSQQAGLAFGIEETPGGIRVHVPGGQVPRLGAFRVEGDWSAAAFPLAAGAVSGGDVTVTGLRLDSPQGDRAIVRHLASFGCNVTASAVGVRLHGTSPLDSPGTIDVGATPDLFPALAVVAAFSRGSTTFAGGAQLRAKESDRIRAMADGLGRMGIRCEERADGLVVHGGRPRGAAIASREDHRIHMAFAVAGLGASGTTTVDGAGSAAVSYPGFHDALRHLGARVGTVPEVQA